jgi:hypothetical protein
MQRMSATLPDTAAPRARNDGIDALRAGTTLLVVLHHTAITYGAIGGWYYKETLTDGSLSSMLLVFFCTLNQAWFMGLFFLLAGYYTPPSLQAKGAWRYLRDRLQRLGIPLIVYGFIIGPATIALAQTALSVGPRRRCAPGGARHGSRCRFCRLSLCSAAGCWASRGGQKGAGMFPRSCTGFDGRYSAGCRLAG